MFLYFACWWEWLASISNRHTSSHIDSPRKQVTRDLTKVNENGSIWLVSGKDARENEILKLYAIIVHTSIFRGSSSSYVQPENFMSYNSY